MKNYRHYSIFSTLSRGLHKYYLFIMMVTSVPRLFAHLHRQAWYRNTLFEWLKPCLNDNPGDWLEIGCGPGLLSKELADRGIRIHALDASVAMLDYAERHKPKNADFPRYSQGNAMQLAYPDQSFDWVVAASLINVVDQPVSVIKEMLRVAKPAAGIAVLLPAPTMNLAKVESTIQRLALKPAHAAALTLWASNARKLSAQQIEHDFRSAGAEQIQIINALDNMLLYVYARKPLSV